MNIEERIAARRAEIAATKAAEMKVRPSQETIRERVDARKAEMASERATEAAADRAMYAADWNAKRVERYRKSARKLSIKWYATIMLLTPVISIIASYIFGYINPDLGTREAMLFLVLPASIMLIAFAGRFIDPGLSGWILVGIICISFITGGVPWMILMIALGFIPSASNLIQEDDRDVVDEALP